jgi:hypothetical protein
MTSPDVASISSRVLRDESEGRDRKSSAGSALAQARETRRKRSRQNPRVKRVKKRSWASRGSGR